MYEIYLITNRVNGKVYVGKTGQGLDVRWKDHRTLSESGSKACPILYRAMRKHGIDNFSISVLRCADSLSEANELEKQLIREFGSRNSDKGYNVASGGDGAGTAEDHHLYLNLDMDKIKDLYCNQGLSAIKISKILGVTEGVILYRLEILGVEKRLSTSDKRKLKLKEAGREDLTKISFDDVRVLYVEEGKSIIYIAKTYYTFPSQIGKILQRGGIVLHGNKKADGDFQTCTRCSAEKPISEFYVNKAVSNNRTSICRDCGLAAANKWYDENERPQRAAARAIRLAPKTEKSCTRCGVLKPIEDFYRGRLINGTSQCILCYKTRNREKTILRQTEKLISSAEADLVTSREASYPSLLDSCTCGTLAE